MRIILFPYSGGNKNCYNRITSYLGERCKYKTIELGGRGLKREMPFCTNFEAVVNELKNEIYEFVVKGNKVIFFGHSLGAYLALEVAKLFLNEGIKISRIVLSGVVPAKCMRKDYFFYNKKDQMVFFEKLGGFPKMEKYRKELINYIYPLLKMDFELLKDYLMNEAYFDSKSIDINAVVLYGEQDILCNPEDIYKWQEYFLSPVKVYKMGGNHFCINDNPKYVAEKILN